MLSNNPTETAEYLRKVAQHTPALIYVFNQDIGQHEYTNENIRRVLGYSFEDVLQMGLELMTDNLHPADASRVYLHIERLQDLPDGETRTIEYRMRHRNGHWVTLISQDSVFQRDEDGRVISHIGVALELSGLAEGQAEPLALSA